MGSEMCIRDSSTEGVLFPLQRRPLQQRDGRGLLLVAAHVAHERQPLTTCRRRCTSKQCSSRLRTARTSTNETRGQACWSRILPVAMQPREGADPSLANQLFAPLSASMLQFCQPRAPHLTASLREQPAQASVPPLHLVWGGFRPARSYAPGQANWNRDPG